MPHAEYRYRELGTVGTDLRGLRLLMQNAELEFLLMTNTQF